jgi:RNA polymerase sigma-70 factor, ECF subfamily
MVFPMTQPTEISDAALVTAVGSRQAEALRLLYQRYGGLVYKLSLRILQQPEAAADTTQEVFLSLWNRPERYDPQRGSLAVFLSVVTRSQSLNRIRQQQSQYKLVERLGRGAMDIPREQKTGLENLALEELGDRMRSAMQHLPEAQRQVLEMAYYEGLSQSDITKQTGIPLGTVKTRSRQGLLKLQNLLRDWVED